MSYSIPNKRGNASVGKTKTTAAKLNTNNNWSRTKTSTTTSSGQYSQQNEVESVNLDKSINTNRASKETMSEYMDRLRNNEGSTQSTSLNSSNISESKVSSETMSEYMDRLRNNSESTSTSLNSSSISENRLPGETMSEYMERLNQMKTNPVYGPGGKAPIDLSYSRIVQDGDTLSKIARENNLSVDELLEANPELKSHPNEINIGDTVKIPSKNSPLSATSTQLGASNKSQASNLNTTGSVKGGSGLSGTNNSKDLNLKTHEVAKGDTLSKIAHENGVSVAELAAFNHIENPDEIEIGQFLQIPSKTETFSLYKSLLCDSYTVEKGDTLLKVAEKYGFDYQYLAELNHIENVDYIEEGQTIFIPNQEKVNEFFKGSLNNIITAIKGGKNIFSTITELLNSQDYVVQANKNKKSKITEYIQEKYQEIVQTAINQNALNDVVQEGLSIITDVVTKLNNNTKDTNTSAKEKTEKEEQKATISEKKEADNKAEEKKEPSKKEKSEAEEQKATISDKKEADNKAEEKTKTSKKEKSETETETPIIEDKSDIQIDIQKYQEELEQIGLRKEDIARVINGEITIEELIQEIESDKDNSRRREIMIASYLKSADLNCTTLEELQEKIAEKQKELEKIQAQKNQKANEHKFESLANIIARLQNGESLENVLESEIVAYEYTDENGKKAYVYENPWETGEIVEIQYKSLTFEEMYGSEEIDSLKKVLTEIDPLFGGKIHRFDGSKEQEEYLTDFYKRWDQVTIDAENYEEKINKLIEEKNLYQAYYDYIKDEVDYYMSKIDPYINKDDFQKNLGEDGKIEDTLTKILDRTKYQPIYDENGNLIDYCYHGSRYNSSHDIITIADKGTLMEVLNALINGSDQFINNGSSLISSKEILYIQADDKLLSNFEKWAPLMTDEEVQVFNYIYNTEGYEKAYEHLKSISERLDNRWLANQTQMDAEYAKEHPVLSSISSIVVTPIEGISAACHSISALINKEEILRTDIYSKGDTWRNTISQDLLQNYEHGKLLSFLYSTGMSMADSLSLIGANTLTGGIASSFISAGLMGSRAYVSTLNDAKNRGLSDAQAVSVAFTSAVIESAMENYSLSHLVNLESSLGNVTSNIVSKIATEIDNKSLANIASKVAYVASSTLSQSLCEGEEEFATEILNYIADEFISGDLSNRSLEINQALENGYTIEEANQMAKSSFMNQLFQSFLGGFVSGSVFGSFGGVKTTHNISSSIATDIMEQYNITKENINEFLENLGTSKAEMFANQININQQIMDAQEAGSTVKDKIQSFLNYLFSSKTNVNQDAQIDTQSTNITNENVDEQENIDLEDPIEIPPSQEKVQQFIKNILEKTKNIPQKINNIYEIVNESTLLKMIDVQKSLLGVATAFPSVFNKFRSEKVSSNVAFMSKIAQEGLVHITSEEAASKILESGYVKASGNVITSYGKSKAFFFSGIPEFGAACLNIGDFMEKAVAVRIKPTVSDLQEFTYRAYDDEAIMHNGDYHFNPENAEIVYLGLTINEAGNFEYKEITEEEYQNYHLDVSNALENAPQIIKNLVNTIKGTMFGLAYQYDIFLKQFNLLDQQMISDKNITKIDTSLILDETTLNDSSSTFNVLNTYEGYDFVYQIEGSVDENLEQLLSEIVPGKKNLIEINSTTQITTEALEKLPDNVEIRVIGGYTDAYMDSPTSSSREEVTYTVKELKDILKEIEKFEKQLDPTWTAYQKSLFAYDYLLDNIDYHERTYSKEQSGLLSLLTKEADDIGFANLYKELLNRLGINCTVINGNIKGVGLQAYTVVQIENDVFVVDNVREYHSDHIGIGIEDTSDYIALHQSDLLNKVNSSVETLSSKLVYPPILSSEYYNIRDTEFGKRRYQDKSYRNIIDYWDTFDMKIPRQLGEYFETMINDPNVNLGIHRTEIEGSVFESDVLHSIFTDGLKNFGALFQGVVSQEVPDPHKTVSPVYDAFELVRLLKSQYTSPGTYATSTGAIMVAFPADLVDEDGVVLPGKELEVYDVVNGVYIIKPEFILGYVSQEDGVCKYYTKEEVLNNFKIKDKIESEKNHEDEKIDTHESSEVKEDAENNLLEVLQKIYHIKSTDNIEEIEKQYNYLLERTGLNPLSHDEFQKILESKDFPFLSDIILKMENELSQEEYKTLLNNLINIDEEFVTRFPNTDVCYETILENIELLSLDSLRSLLQKETNIDRKKKLIEKAMDNKQLTGSSLQQVYNEQENEEMKKFIFDKLTTAEQVEYIIKEQNEDLKYQLLDKILQKDTSWVSNMQRLFESFVQDSEAFSNIKDANVVPQEIIKYILSKVENPSSSFQDLIQIIYKDLEVKITDDDCCYDDRLELTPEALSNMDIILHETGHAVLFKMMDQKSYSQTEISELLENVKEHMSTNKEQIKEFEAACLQQEKEAYDKAKTQVQDTKMSSLIEQQNANFWNTGYPNLSDLLIALSADNRFSIFSQEFLSTAYQHTQEYYNSSEDNYIHEVFANYFAIKQLHPELLGTLRQICGDEVVSYLDKIYTDAMDYATAQALIEEADPFDIADILLGKNVTSLSEQNQARMNQINNTTLKEELIKYFYKEFQEKSLNLDVSRDYVSKCYHYYDQLKKNTVPQIIDKNSITPQLDGIDLNNLTEEDKQKLMEAFKERYSDESLYDPLMIFEPLYDWGAIRRIDGINSNEFFKKASIDIMKNGIDVGEKYIRLFIFRAIFSIYRESNSDILLNYVNNYALKYNLSLKDVLTTKSNTIGALAIIDNQIYVLSDYYQQQKKILEANPTEALNSTTLEMIEAFEEQAQQNINATLYDEYKELLQDSISKILESDVKLTALELNVLVNLKEKELIDISDESINDLIEKYVNEYQGNIKDILYKDSLPLDVKNKIMAGVSQERLDYLSLFDEGKGAYFGADQELGEKFLKYGLFSTKEFRRLKNKLKEQGMSARDAVKTLKKLNATGACSYAAIVNMIFMKYKDNPSGFKKDFGFDMYTNIDGKNRLNTAELLLDMYIYINSNLVNQSGENLFSIKDGVLSLENMNTENQIYLSQYYSISENEINQYFAFKKNHLEINCDEAIDNSKIYTKEQLQKKIIQALQEGKEIDLGIYTKPISKELRTPSFRMYQEGKYKRPVYTTRTWNSEGHAVYVVGANDFGIIVSSWGKKLVIPYEDFINSTAEGYGYVLKIINIGGMRNE